jgi:hypothetical protein
MPADQVFWSLEVGLPRFISAIGLGYRPKEIAVLGGISDKIPLIKRLIQNGNLLEFLRFPSSHSFTEAALEVTTIMSDE